MSNFKIDHFVFGANTLSEGSNAIKKILDEDLSEINTHETMGTHNRVISLGSSYLEIIALDPENQNENSNTWFKLSDKIYREKFLKIPKLISFVISVKPCPLVSKSKVDKICSIDNQLFGLTTLNTNRFIPFLLS